MRAFIAIGFGELNGYFFQLQKQMPVDMAKLNLTKTFHLTLKFLGEVPDDKIEEIKERLRKIRLGPFTIKTANIGFFPNENYIRVVWVGLEPKEMITELQKRVDNELSAFFPKDERFHPHVTLARVKFIKDKNQFLEKIKTIKTESKLVDVKNFKLIKSTLTGQGPIYEDLGVFG